MESLEKASLAARLDIGRQIRSARIERKISIRDFADLVGCSHYTVCRIEAGENAQSGILGAMAAVLGISITFGKERKDKTLWS